MDRAETLPRPYLKCISTFSELRLPRRKIADFGHAKFSPQLYFRAARGRRSCSAVVMGALGGKMISRSRSLSASRCSRNRPTRPTHRLPSPLTPQPGQCEPARPTEDQASDCCRPARVAAPSESLCRVTVPSHAESWPSTSPATNYTHHARARLDKVPRPRHPAIPAEPFPDSPS